MEHIDTFLVLALIFMLGMFCGSAIRDSRWRSKGDHDYMNRMESGGKLYQIRREQ